jgi:YggT family protein
MPTEVIPFLGMGLMKFLQIYSYILIARILLTWFPSLDWSSPPLAILSQLTDPYLNLFRSLLPPIGGFDLSPMLAIILLQVVGSTVLPLLLNSLISIV